MAHMPAEVRRSRLVEAAIAVMGRDGVAAATTRAVVAEAGMSLASFHYCFRSRNEMVREVITTLGQVEREAAIGAMQAGTDLRGLLGQAVDGYLAFLEANPSFELVLFELNHHALRTPALADLAAEQYRQYYDSATRVLDAAAATAGVTWKVDVSVLARMVVTVIDGATTTWLVDHDSEATRAALDPLLDHLTTLAAHSPIIAP